ncbi:hypothetical protein ACPCXA_04790 [Lysinibacillus agricola]
MDFLSPFILFKLTGALLEEHWVAYATLFFFIEQTGQFILIIVLSFVQQSGHVFEERFRSIY